MHTTLSTGECLCCTHSWKLMWCMLMSYFLFCRYPWGQEAFEKARNEDKPIFLSGETCFLLTGVLCKSRNVFCNSASLWTPVGYSTCHWCHVMERESFKDKEIGKILSDNFVCIKLDREERPDVDKVYMTFVQVAAFFISCISLLWQEPHSCLSLLISLGNKWKWRLAHECMVDPWPSPFYWRDVLPSQRSWKKTRL